MDTKLTLRTLMDKSIVSDLPYEDFPTVMDAFVHIVENMFALDSVLRLDNSHTIQQGRPWLNMKIET